MAINRDFRDLLSGLSAASLNRIEYQRLRRQLDEELRAGMEMLQAGYQAKVEALDALWGEPPFEEVSVSEPELPAPTPEPPESSSPEPSLPPTLEPAAPAAEPRSVRRLDGEVETDIKAVLEQLDDVFQKSDLCRALGYEPPRTSLYRALATLEREGIIRIESFGGGRRANLYRKARNEADG